jgi:hypothetical protein
MQKKITGVLLSALLVVFLAGCIIDPRPQLITTSDGLTSFPKAEILGAAFFTNVTNTEYTGQDAGNIRENEDGTYTVRMRRRDRPLNPSAMYIMGSFEFSDYYKIICTFPDDAVYKPYRVYAFASRNMDLAIDADYRTATDLRGAAWPTGSAQGGPIIMSNEGGTKLSPDRRGRPYVTVVLYLYFNRGSDINDPNDFYEFTLHAVRGGNGVTPASKAIKAEVYRAGDTNPANRFVLEDTLETVGGVTTGEPVLARFNHRYDSGTISTANTQSLNVDLAVPDGEGKEIEFEIRHVGLFSGNTTNLISKEMIESARVLPGITESEQTGVVTAEEVSSTPVSYYYKVKAKIVNYNDMTGVKLVIPGVPGTFTGTDRFTFTLNVPDKYVGE